ncbi:(Trans)glycosidase [Venustampulla echinocandica]|uniref:glucan endo-1,3-beta-D-glucosidase n=1 Tax=Venustampulla echinocandica TaxID=2656787 RepID=A0A370U1P9_9HELO|nr:(Trans)glycosidase [Venustampulla echinocandica]RDL41673.1 (Trans)glycosidase [Venustampulla echinocandica]
MSRRYSFEEPYDGRRTPLHSQPQSQPEQQHPQYQPEYQPQYQPEYQSYAPQQQPQQYAEQPYLSQNSPPINPAAHPDSSFNRLRAERRYSRGADQTSPNPNPFQSPTPPPHRDPEGRYWGRDMGYANTNSPFADTTPGVDNFGAQAGGGLTGIAMSIADANARESGLEAMRHTPGYVQHPQREISPFHESDSPYARTPQSVSSSPAPLGAAAFPPGSSTPQARPIPLTSHNNFPQNAYGDIPHRYSRNLDPNLTQFDPNIIEDDGDDGLEYRTPNRTSMLSLGHHSDRNVPAAAGAAGGAAAAGGVMGVLGGLVGKNGNNGAQQYDPVHGHYAPNEYNLDGPEKKSEWLNKQSTGKKKLRWAVGILAALLLLGAIAGGVVGGILGSKKKSSSSDTTANGQSASADLQSNGDLNKDSAEIKKLLNNKNLHKVFPGVDYTPMYTQYPDCIHYPASQNNVTRDVAVLSQLTNTIRLYGTDCNQTELVIHAINQLGLKDKVKIWMGVWQDKNVTTNARQLEQMYKIFDTYGADPFVGVIVGNEVLFRKDMTATELGTLISGVRTNLTTKGIKLPVASADLGDNWTQDFADKVDYVMANIHPFFAGVESKSAAAWTWTFWQGKDAALKTDPSKNIISETGWPSQGGTDCGMATTCTTGSVAAIPDMNNFMNDWVCQALANGTNYFWFEAFDEPWKWTFNEPGKEWEDQWGLMDVNRDLKPGVVIPSCGGKTVG